MKEEKLGKLITESRKKQNLTQEALAEKLGVSKNLVSKWERGLSFPDKLLYKKIAKELDIDVEEIMDDDYIDKEELMAFLRKIKNKLIIILVLFVITVICIIAFTIYYKRAIKINLINDSDYLYEEAINYLKKQDFKTNPDAKEIDFNTFYSYYGFGIEEKDEYKYAYMWIYNHSFYLEDTGALAVSTSSSMPYKFTFLDDVLINVEHSEDGDEYISSVKETFPVVISKQVLDFDKKSDNVSKLAIEANNRMYKYYDYLNLDMGKLTMDDLIYDDIVFTITAGDKKCIPVRLNVYKDNRYVLYTSYAACPPGKTCTMELRYTDFIEGEYDFDVMQIIRHSEDANLMTFTKKNMPKYEIYSGKWHSFITDDDNRYLLEFLESIDVNLEKCAKKSYKK